MVFSSLFFVFFFLVLSYGIYFFARGIKAKNIVLLISSLIFYAWGGPVLVLLFCLMTFVCYMGALLIDQNTLPSIRRALCITTVAVCIAILFIFKYAGFTLSITYSIFGISSVVPSIALPIGISFYTFQLMSYVIDVYRRSVEVQKKYWLLLLYASLFHQCIAGPIVRYADVNDEIMNRKITLSDMSQGISRFSVGLAKKAILANGCGVITDSIFNSEGVMMSAEGIGELSSAAILLASLCYMLQLYLDFSAYSDMAIGMGLMIGFHYKENFNYPYIAHSATDFWRRWHMSLSSWFREYVYIPLGGNRKGLGRQILNMAAVWLLTGLWHGAAWNFVLWGVFYFVILVLEKLFLLKVFDRGPATRALGHIWALVLVGIGWMLFDHTDLSAAFSVIGGLFGIGMGGFASPVTVYELCRALPLLLVAALAATPYPAKLLGRLRDKSRVAAVCEPVGILILLILSTAYMVSGTFSPFLYFNF